MSGVRLLAAVAAVAARLTLPAGEITVGDPVVLKLTVTHPPATVFDHPDTARLQPPAPAGQTPPRFLVEEVQPIESKPPVPGETSWSIRIRPFAPGDTKIPALSLSYRLPGSSESLTVSTEPLDLHVMSVLTGPDEPPADIKGPWWMPRSWWPWIAAAVAALAALAAAVWLWRRWRRRQPAPAPIAVAAVAPIEPPWQRAMRELDRLLASGLPAQGKIKEFHVLLSEIVKRFLGAHYGFDALDRTTQEVLGDLSRAGVDAGTQQRVRLFLEACDLVKFARHRPPVDRIDETIAAARALIELGRPRAPEQTGGVAA